jgi:hypothetical protein
LLGLSQALTSPESDGDYSYGRCFLSFHKEHAIIHQGRIIFRSTLQSLFFFLLRLAIKKWRHQSNFFFLINVRKCWCVFQGIPKIKSFAPENICASFLLATQQIYYKVDRCSNPQWLAQQQVQYSRKKEQTYHLNMHSNSICSKSGK